MAERISLSEIFQPTDAETGAVLPPARTFVIEGLGFGTVQMVYHDNPDQNSLQVVFNRPRGRGNEDDVIIESIRDRQLSARDVIKNREVLAPHLREIFLSSLSSPEQ
ncbi:MAG TPA: hypothetical protein VLG27_00330 [Candidatus Saccharimonadia bacterium]|nr:hypothetical protein [Candidatus Saccharimonadia bacterium]